jgi:catechol 2,3-dioxygenase-like lactoylglutathione lyase family enzyme
VSYGDDLVSAKGFDSQITFLFVDDLERSAAFYGEVLGLELARDQGACRIYRVAEHAYLGVCDHGAPDPGGIIVTLVADDVDAWARRVAAAGHDVEGPSANERFGLRHCFVRDPDGHLVEIQRFDEPL